MPQFPPIPSWNSLHPMIIHFPIVLLLLSPLFVLIGAVLSPAKGQPYRIVALILLLLGTGSLFLAAATGEAASKLAARDGPVNAVLQSHEALAEESEFIFSALSAILLGIVALPRFLRREESRMTTTLMPLSFLVLYCVGILFVVNTAHAGARLVHEFGLHAIIPENGQSSASPAVQQAAEMDVRK